MADVPAEESMRPFRLALPPCDEEDQDVMCLMQMKTRGIGIRLGSGDVDTQPCWNAERKRSRHGG